jgi:hypothetical protein
MDTCGLQKNPRVSYLPLPHIMDLSDPMNHHHHNSLYKFGQNMTKLHEPRQVHPSHPIRL